MHRRGWVLWALVLGVWAALALAAPAPVRAAETPRFEEDDCPFEPPARRRVDCGWLVVPELRSDPNSPEIRLAVAIFRSSSRRPAPDPIVYLEGGPGGSGVDSLVEGFDAFSHLLDYSDLITFDQRGTGYSEPALHCPESEAVDIDLLDEPLPYEEQTERELAGLYACRDRLVAEGVNLAAYTSAASAADLNDLRLALGYDEWNLYGISYGTRLALVALRDFPEGIRSVVIDGLVPLQTDITYVNVGATVRSFNLLFAACAADPACDAAFPDLERVFYEVVDTLNEHPAAMEVEDPDDGKVYAALLTGDDLINTMFQMLYATSIIPYLPQMIYDVRDGDYDLWSLLKAFDLDSTFSVGMQLTLNCYEEYSYIDVRQIAGAVRRITRRYPTSAPLVAHHVFDAQTQVALCANWGIPFADPAIENAPVYSEVPALVTSGEFDPITPPSLGRQTARTLPNSFVYEFPGMGHGASVDGDCPIDIVLQFLEDPTTEPDASCIADMGPPEFVLPLTQLELVEYTDLLNTFRSVVPADWEELVFGIFSNERGNAIIAQRSAEGGERAARADAIDLLNLLDDTLGLTALPPSQGRHRSPALTWSLFEVDTDVGTADVATAQQGSTGYYVMVLTSLGGDRDALYDLLFLPALDAFEVLD